jgi:uncharacterized membrane protein YebE (DUF533 family)
MPVRIVKDNPDEMVVNDNFNFENPQDQGNQGSGGQGGGIDLSFLNNLLGGGGGGQGGGINIMDLLGGGSGNNRGGGGILDLLGGGGQSNQGGSGGAGLLGGLISSFLGGGSGNQVNRGGSSGGNGLLSMLGGMAVNACINYAINSFMNKGGGKGSFSKGAPTQEDMNDLLNERLHSAEMCVSIWSYSVYADEQLQTQEKQALQSLINDTVQQLFPSSVADQNEVRQILLDRVNNPLDYNEIVNAASQDYNFAGQLYQQACLLIAADQVLGGAEDNYLQDLADDLGLSANDAATVRQKFGMN